MLKLKCGPQYPDQPPLIAFTTKIIMPGVDASTGIVNLSQFMRWTKTNTMYDALVALRINMASTAAKIKQPNPEDTFPNINL